MALITALKILLLAILFVISGGALFTEWARKHKFLVFLATLVSIAAAYYLFRDIYTDLKRDVSESVRSAPTLAEAQEELSEQDICSAEFFSVRKGETVCNFMFTENSELILDGRSVANPVLGTGYPALYVVVFPASRAGRYYFIQSCSDPDPKYRGSTNNCWNHYVLDRETWQFQETEVGKYGPHRKIAWSQTEQFAAIMYSNEGASQAWVVDASTGESWSYPNWSPLASAWESGEYNRVDPSHLRWVGPKTFELRVLRCLPGDAFERCHQLDISKNGRLQKFLVTPDGIKILE